MESVVTEPEINLFKLLLNPIIREQIVQYLKFDQVFRLRRLSRSMKTFVDEIYLPELTEFYSASADFYFRYRGEPNAETIKILSEHTRSLEIAKILDVEITDQFIQMIKSNSNLYVLCLSNCKSLSWDFIKSVFDLKKLRSLILTCHYSSPTEWALSDLEMTNFERALSTSSIHTIRLTGCTWVTDFILKAFSQCKDLRYLSLGHCDKITNVGFGYLSNGCPSLVSLTLEANDFFNKFGINSTILDNRGVRVNINNWSMEQIEKQAAALFHFYDLDD